MPIPEVETLRVSRIAGVRVTHDAITKPGRKKKVKRAQVRSFKAFLCVADMKDDQLKEGMCNKISKNVYICTCAGLDCFTSSLRVFLSA
jgi:hypothetical protein